MQKKRFTFVCNEYGYKNPSLGSEKKLYTLLRSKTTWSIGFQVSIKNFLTVLTAFGVKLIFAKLNKNIRKTTFDQQKNCTHSWELKPLGLKVFMRSSDNLKTNSSALKAFFYGTIQNLFNSTLIRLLKKIIQLLETR